MKNALIGIVLTLLIGYSIWCTYIIRIKPDGKEQYEQENEILKSKYDSLAFLIEELGFSCDDVYEENQRYETEVSELNDALFVLDQELKEIEESQYIPPIFKDTNEVHRLFIQHITTLTEL